MAILPSRNPFGAGMVFQLHELEELSKTIVAIPLEQGRFFNFNPRKPS